MFAQLRRDIREMWSELREYHELLAMMIRRDLMLRYRQTVMGVGWAVFMPVINTVVFTLIFKKVAKIETDVPLSGVRLLRVAAMEHVRTSLKTGINSLFNNTSLLTKVYFPREVFPFSTMLVCVVDFVVGLSVLGVLMLYYWIPLSPTALFLPVLIAVQLMFTAGLCMFLAPANLYYRDVKYIAGRARHRLDVCDAGDLPDPSGHWSARRDSATESARPDHRRLPGHPPSRRTPERRSHSPARPRCRSCCLRSVGSSFTAPNIPSRRTPDVASSLASPSSTCGSDSRRTERHRALRDLIPSLIKRAVRGRARVEAG